MEITKEVIEKRLADLRVKKEEILGQLNAYEGAIQDCQWFLARAIAEVPEPAPELRLVEE